jgi:monoamine oxidase
MMEKNTPHILIIGAGIAGLMAASLLIRKNYRITIIEARDRTGGRIQTLNKPFSFPVEAGAEFIHGEKPLTISLLRKAGIEIQKVQGKFYTYKDGKLENEAAHDPGWDLLLKKLSKLEVDETIASFLNRNFKEDKYKGLVQNVKSFVEGYDAADMNRVSALSLLNEWKNSDDEDQYRIDRGYGELIKYLERQITSEGAQLNLSAEVRHVEWSSRKVLVTTVNGNRIEGDQLIITLPLGVLQKRSVSFEPSLPANYVKAIDDIGFGTVTKFLFEFNTSFWQQVILAKRKDLAFQFSDAEIPTWWSQSPLPFPLLTGWQGGPSVVTKSRSKEDLFNRAIQSMSYLFDCSRNAIEKNIQTYAITNWTDDPFSYGAYAYATVESNKARKVMCNPILDTIYFAGEAFYNGPAMGTVEAALHSATLTTEFF